MDRAKLAKIHILLKETNLVCHKADLVLSFTNGRSSSLKEMTDQEAKGMLSYLNSRNILPATEKMKNKLIAMAHELGWKKADGKIDMDRLNGWCKKYSYRRKPMDQYTYEEFPKLLTQFEQGPYLSYLNKK